MNVDPWHHHHPSSSLSEYKTIENEDESSASPDIATDPTMSFLRNPATILGGLNLSAIAGSTYYLRSHHVYNLEEFEARLDEIEGTLRGHIGLIEESLDRLEGKATEADRGNKM